MITTQKTQIRLKLILACLSVASLVSAIYVTVSYRLASDTISRSELARMSDTIHMLKQSLPSESGSPLLLEKVKLIEKLNVDNGTGVMIQLKSSKRSIEEKAGIDSSEATFILSEINKQLSASSSASPIIEYEEKCYIWIKEYIANTEVTFVKETIELEVARQLILKRLAITSLIVFWITVWLALTLSSIIAKRVEKINEKLTELATHDSLTGLANRLYLTEALHAFAEVQKNNSRKTEGCLIAIDLDKFKSVNDAFGHSTGDALLVAVSKRIQSVVSPPCKLFRIGGDEFIIWAPSFTLADGEALVRNIVAACDSTVPIDGLDINTCASAGLAHFPTHTDNPEALISCADTAMYTAKKQRSSWIVYDPSTSPNSETNVILRAGLNKAIINQQLVLHFQPKVHIRTGKIVGVEGLCRWEHPELGTLTPNSFMDLIEHSGKVQEFGRYIIERAIQHSAAWIALGYNIPIAINLSPYNLLDTSLPSFIKRCLEKHGVPSNLIEIELTENETCINIANIESALKEIKKLGVDIAIDDFGTGMSSLAYLDHLGADTIKIDKAFISDIDNNKRHVAIVASAISLAKTFDCTVVAEGVEKQCQADILEQLGCTIAQGFLYAKPMPQDELILLINNS